MRSSYFLFLSFFFFPSWVFGHSVNHMKKPTNPRQKLVERERMGSEVDFIKWERKANRAKKVNASDKLRQDQMDHLSCVS